MRWLFFGIVWSLVLHTAGTGRTASCPAGIGRDSSYPHPVAEETGSLLLSPLRQLHEYRQICRALHTSGQLIQQDLFYAQPLTGAQLNQLAQRFRDFVDASARMRDLLVAIKPDSICFRAHPLASIQWLSMQTVAAEEFRAVCELFFLQPELRRLISNLPRKDGENIFWPRSLPGYLLSSGTGREVAAGMSALQAWKAGENAACTKADPGFMHWLEKLLATDSWTIFNQGGKLDSIFSVRSFRDSRREIAANALMRTTGGGVINAAVGGFLGASIRMYNRRANDWAGRKIMEQMDSLPQPLDLILQKRYFSVGNYLVPGYWQHSAVWLGTREQLQELGVWGHPALEPWREIIEQGHIVYEFRFDGLSLTRPEIFFNADEMAVLRVNNLDWQGGQEMVAEIYRQLAAQRNKQYDYGFNLKALDRVTCTDVIFLAFSHINWPRQSLLGRSVILPDHVAELAFHRHSPLQFIAYYAIHENLRKEKLSMEELARTVDFFADSTAGGSEEGGEAFPRFVRINHRRDLAATFQGGTLQLRLRRRAVETRPRYVEPNAFEVEP